MIDPREISALIGLYGSIRLLDFKPEIPDLTSGDIQETTIKRKPLSIK